MISTLNLGMATGGDESEFEILADDHGRESQPSEVQATASVNSILLKVYLSHFLSTWNSRMFEFAAVLFLAVITPGTLLYASIYALLRSLAAALLSARVGAYIDRANRLSAIRASIVWQRIPVAASCLLFAALLLFPDAGRGLFAVCFAGTVLLACVEKIAAVGNTVAVERDWVVVLAESLGAERRRLNATMRRIDLLCKLVAPVFISFVQSYSTVVAVLVVLGLNVVSVLLEYFAIARVYHSVPELARKKTSSSRSIAPEELNMPLLRGDIEDLETLTTENWQGKSSFPTVLAPWTTYFTSPAFLASFSLSILYLTVLSTGVQYQTYMLSIGYSSIAVSLLRLAAVISELMATCVAPLLMKRIGGVRSGLWSINWQVLWLAAAVVTFEYFGNGSRLAGAVLTAGIVMSRLGLWGFDLAVQDIVQEVMTLRLSSRSLTPFLHVL